MSAHKEHLKDHHDAMTLLYTTMVGMDGKTDVREMKEMMDCLSEWGLSSDEIQTSLKHCQSFYGAGGNTADAMVYVCDLIKDGVTESSRKSVVKDLGRIALADQNLDATEVALLKLICIQLDVNIEDL